VNHDNKGYRILLKQDLKFNKTDERESPPEAQPARENSSLGFIDTLSFTHLQCMFHCPSVSQINDINARKTRPKHMGVSSSGGSRI